MNKHEDDLVEGIRPTSEGIRNCLRMLAQEAASLNMAETLRAIHEALAVCHAEGGSAGKPYSPAQNLH